MGAEPVRVALGAVLAAALACTGLGPKPVVEDVRLSPVREGELIVSVTVRNAGPGDGAAGLTVTLRDRGGAVVARKTEIVELQPNERIAVEVSFPVGEGQYEAEAEARYPVD